MAHLGALRGRVGCLALLAERGFDFEAESSRGWNAMDEATAVRNKAALRFLYETVFRDALTRSASLQPRVLAAVREMPDFSMTLDWRFSSPVFGYLLRKLAPSDTYRIHKRGARLRVDGSLRGADPGSGLIPRWEYGEFSVLVCGDDSPPRVLLLDHGRRLAMPLAQQVDEHCPADVDRFVDRSVAAGVARVQLQLRDRKCQAQSTWLGMGGAREEDVNGYRARVIDLSGTCVTRVTEKTPLCLPGAVAGTEISDAFPGTSYADFLRLEFPADGEDELPVQSLFQGVDAQRLVREAAAEAAARDGSEGHAPPRGGGGYEAFGAELEREARAEAAAREATHGPRPAPRAARARCWVTDAFPLRPEHLRPLLSLLASANPALKQAATVVETFGADRFPVKAQVPLLLSVNFEISFSRFEFWGAAGGEAPDMGVPRGYRELSLSETTAFFQEEARRKQEAAAGRGRRGRAATEATVATEPAGAGECGPGGAGAGEGGGKGPGDPGRPGRLWGYFRRDKDAPPTAARERGGGREGRDGSDYRSASSSEDGGPLGALG